MMKKLLAFLFLCVCETAVFAQQQVVIPQSASPTTDNEGEERRRARLHTELGSMYLRAGNPNVALEEANTAINADPSYGSAYNLRGLINMMLGETALAESDLKQALSTAPGDPDINHNYGWFLCRNGKPAEALSYFKKALDNPLYATPAIAWTNLGACAIDAGQYDAAQEALNKGLRLTRGNNLRVRAELARLAYKQGHLKEARARLLDVLHAIPGQPPAEALWLGVRIERKLGNKADEDTLTMQLQRLYPASPEYQELLKGNYE
jgi:type IV pilus assembly protein PilF